MQSKSKKNDAEIQTIHPAKNEPGQWLTSNDIDIYIKDDCSVRERYYMGKIDGGFIRGKIKGGDQVTISKTDPLSKGCYVALRTKDMEPGKFGLYIFEGWDSKNFEYLLDDPTQKKKTIKKIMYNDILTMHKIQHVIKIDWADDL